MTVRATRGARLRRIQALAGAAVLLVALTTPAGAQSAASRPNDPGAAEVALCWSLLGGGIGAMLAAYNWRGADPNRPPSAPPPDLVSRPELLMAGAGIIAVGAWQCKRVGDKRRRARLELAPSGIRLSW